MNRLTLLSDWNIYLENSIGVVDTCQQSAVGQAMLTLFVSVNYGTVDWMLYIAKIDQRYFCKSVKVDILLCFAHLVTLSIRYRTSKSAFFVIIRVGKPEMAPFSTRLARV